MKIVVADGKSEAAFLIASVTEKKHKVVVINSDRAYGKYLANMYKIPVLNGDASKQYVLDEAKIEGFDLLVALSSSDATNLVVCQTAKLLYRVRKTVSIVSNPKSVEIFKRLGIDTAISSAHLIATSIEQASNIETLVQSLSFEHGSIVVSEVLIDESCLTCGKKIMDIRFTDEMNVSCIIRGSEMIIPKGHTIVTAGDKLVVVSSAEKQKGVIEMLTGTRQVA